MSAYTFIKDLQSSFVCSVVVCKVQDFGYISCVHK